MPNENNELAPAASAVAMTIPKSFEGLSLQRAPETVLEEARRAARALADVIAKKPKKVVFGGEIYPEFEDWEMIGRFYSITAATVSTRFTVVGGARGYEATAEALDTRTSPATRISTAESMCMSDEANWQHKPLFQLRSMAQTRACAKALRNVLGWVVVLGGLAPTPAEEMREEPEDAPKKRGRPRQERPQEGPPQGVQRLDPEELNRVLAKIEECPDRPSLTQFCNQIFKTTYAKASAMGDQKSIDAIKTATEKRLAELAQNQMPSDYGVPGVFAEK